MVTTEDGIRLNPAVTHADGEVRVYSDHSQREIFLSFLVSSQVRVVKFFYNNK